MEMKMIFLFSLLGISTALLFDGPAWDNLRVTWGRSMTSKHFVEMPRTTTEATKEGFHKISDCDASASSLFRGSRYMKGSDESLILLYDKNGYIAGIQTTLPGKQSNGFPSEKITPPFTLIEKKYYATAYFVEPETICSKGRTEQEFLSQGTGQILLFQNGPSPDTDYIRVPNEQKDTAGTKWVEGKCFPTMGKHYWYDISKDKDCADFFPFFIMYNKGKLNAFGFALVANITSPRFEHAPFRVLSNFVKEIPTCLATVYKGTGVSTMHTFLTNNPRETNFC